MDDPFQALKLKEIVYARVCKLQQDREINVIKTLYSVPVKTQMQHNPAFMRSTTPEPTPAVADAFAHESHKTKPFDDINQDKMAALEASIYLVYVRIPDKKITLHQLVWDDGDEPVKVVYVIW